MDSDSWLLVLRLVNRIGFSVSRFMKYHSHKLSTLLVCELCPDPLEPDWTLWPGEREQAAGGSSVDRVRGYYKARILNMWKKSFTR